MVPHKKFFDAYLRSGDQGCASALSLEWQHSPPVLMRKCQPPRILAQILTRMTRPFGRRSGLISLSKLADYALGTLTMEATRFLSRGYGAFLTVATLPFADAAVDVDKPADLIVSKQVRPNAGGLHSLSIKNVA
jgi:hypothetical protein